MMRNKIYLLFSLTLLVFDVSAQTLDSDFIWNDDETGYYEIKDDNIVLTHFETADHQLVLSSGEIGNINIESFSFSKNKNKVLIFTNSKKVWRYNTRGDYWVYDFEKKETKKLGADFEESSLMFAKFSPDDTHVAYVHKENTKTSLRNRSTKANIS
jgi:dipeptidyl-peptidase-4